MASTEWFLGDNVIVEANVSDATGTPEAGTVTVSVTGPNGMPVSVSSPTTSDAGIYQAIVSNVQLLGTYLAEFTAVVSGFQKSIQYNFNVSRVPSSTAAPLAFPQDVETALVRSLTDTEAAYCPGLIDQASALLRTAVPSIDTRIADNIADPTDLTSVSAATVAAVVAGAVKKYLVNPTGIASTTQTVGPMSASTSYALRSEKETRGVLQFTSDDLAVLFPNRKRNRTGSIRLKAGLAPRPVGNYGPIPGPGQIFSAIVDFGRLSPVVESQLELDAGFAFAGVAVPDGQEIIL